MNRWTGIGRLTKDPVINKDGNVAIARYTLAVDRRGVKTEDPNAQTADFISCVVFGKAVDFVEKWLKKGTKIAVEGHIVTGSYTNKDGQKVFTTDVAIDNHEFVESKGAAQTQAPTPQQVSQQRMAQVQAQTPAPAQVPNNFMDIANADDEELPWA